jgi:aryl-alcohol dehydrogenase-like predicted oxidoreductase
VVSALAMRALGRTGLVVSALGLGAGRIGDARKDEREVSALIDTAIELGITLIDTARGYGLSEERLGRLLGARRAALVLTTKVGYGVEGAPDWTGSAVRAGIERALRTLRTEVLDVCFLHSCPGEVAVRDDILRALEDARCGGAIRSAGYSGENEDLDRAVASGAFGVVQISVSPWDQGSVALRAERLAAEGIGVLAKRPLAGGPWDVATADASEPDVRELRRRFELLAIDPRGEPYDALAIRFAAHAPGVAAALAGTTSPARLRALAAAVAAGPLDASAVSEIRGAWEARGHGLRGIV